MNLECSSKGDKRFSAFYAVVNINGVNNSIESWYQGAKRTADGKVPGKGRPVHHMINPFSGNELPANELTHFYFTLWLRYFKQHPELLKYAKRFDTFTDMFRGRCKNCQADVIRACVINIDSVRNDIKNTVFYKDCISK